MSKELTRAELHAKLEKANALCEKRGAEIVELNKKLTNVQRTLTMKTSEVERLKKKVQELETENAGFLNSRIKDGEMILDLQKENERLEKSNKQLEEMYREKHHDFDKMAWEAAGWKARVEYLMEGGIFRFLREKYLYNNKKEDAEANKDSAGDARPE